LLLEEAARLQSFPDWFTFYGSEASRFNQVGNAVPPLFAYHLAASVRKYLELNRHDSPQEVGRSNPFIQLRLALPTMSLLPTKSCPDRQFAHKVGGR